MRELRTPWKHRNNTHNTSTATDDDEAKATTAKEAGANAVESGMGVHKKDFHNLFPLHYSARQGEMALVLWDFLDSAVPLLGDLSFTLHELIKCIAQPIADHKHILVQPSASSAPPQPVVIPVPTPPSMGQIVFDEVCTLFTGALLKEVERLCVFSHPSYTSSSSSSSLPTSSYPPGEGGIPGMPTTSLDIQWQTALMAKPLNILTWPYVARQALLVIRQYLGPAEALRMFHAPATETNAMILVSHWTPPPPLLLISLIAFTHLIVPTKLPGNTLDLL